MIILVCVDKTEEDASVEFAIGAVSFAVSLAVDNDDVGDDDVVNGEDFGDDDNVNGEDVDGDCSCVPGSGVSGDVTSGGETSINVVL